MSNKEIFEQYFPSLAVDFCFDLWENYDFQFKITKKRLSKFGDYRYHFVKNLHTITVNHDLNPHAFLVTYLHEIAHLVTHIEYGDEVFPHGREWKRIFQQLMTPMLSQDIFPLEILSPLVQHMQNPLASGTSDQRLYTALHDDGQTKDQLQLVNIPIGVKFLFRNKIYRKLEKKRTRSLCELVANGARYMMSEAAPIQQVLD